MHEELVRKEIERRFYGYAPSHIHVTQYKNGKGVVEFLLGLNRSSATFSIKHGAAYLTSGPQDDFYNEYPLFKPPVDPALDFNDCCERAIRLSDHNGKITNFTLVKRYENESYIEFRCNDCQSILRFNQAGGKARWSKTSRV
jgi:hypothetical protein